MQELDLGRFKYFTAERSDLFVHTRVHTQRPILTRRLGLRVRMVDIRAYAFTMFWEIEIAMRDRDKQIETHANTLAQGELSTRRPSSCSYATGSSLNSS